MHKFKKRNKKINSSRQTLTLHLSHYIKLERKKTWLFYKNIHRKEICIVLP